MQSNSAHPEIFGRPAVQSGENVLDSWIHATYSHDVLHDAAQPLGIQKDESSCHKIRIQLIMDEYSSILSLRKQPANRTQLKQNSSSNYWRLLGSIVRWLLVGA